MKQGFHHSPPLHAQRQPAPPMLKIIPSFRGGDFFSDNLSSWVRSRYPEEDGTPGWRTGTLRQETT
eukprot:4925922-Alexandrium_andersonii.AAC.1